MIEPFSQDKKENQKDNYNNYSGYANRLIPYNSQKKKNQNKIIIDNIEIFFPFSPHEIQIIYMKNIIHNLNQKFLLREKYKGIAALESPIGTGKTLCLLCAIIAWINDMRKTNLYNGKIIYVTKTYNKISYIINELNKTYYKPKISILFSPYDGCVNNKINYCISDKITLLKCKYSYYNCEFYKNSLNINDNNNNEDYLDIEELPGFICQKKICPFFYEKNNIENSDIIFMPYDFLFDKNMKKILGYDINNNILIIDDSHNLSKLCQDVNSVSITTKDLEEIIQDLYLFTKSNNKDINLSLKDKIEITEINCEILAINKIINNLNDNKLNILQGEVYPDKGKLLSSKEFLSIFLTKNMNSNDNNKFLEYITLDNINSHINLLKSIEKLIYLHLERITKITLFISILEKIYNFYINQNDNNIDSYCYFLSYMKSGEEPNNSNRRILQKKNEEQIRKLNLYCFDPSLSFKEIINEKPYACFLCSDTLAPFEILENELKINLDIKLQNDHIIENEQYKFSIIQSSLYNDEKILFQLDYIHRSNVKMIIALGYTLLSLCHTNKNGSILVYFPSLAYLNQCNLIWKDNNIIDKLQEINNIYYSQKKLKKLSKLKNSKNYIFLVVFDKNTSPEEIFFKESNLTMVVCLGIPYDTLYSYDDKIQLKIKYLDDKIKKKEIKNKYRIMNELTGEKWYEKNAIYIINRFLGKSLKLLSGYGSLICIDNRYESALNNGLFSSYLKNNCEIINIDNGSYFESLITFFENMNNNYIKGFNFFKNKVNNPNEEKIVRNIEYSGYNCEEEESENYFFNKKHKNKIFYVPDEIKIEEDTSNQKIEDIFLNVNKINKYLNMSDIVSTDKSDFLQKKKKDEILGDDENVKPNKKIKNDEYQNKSYLFNNIFNYDNNIFKNFCEEYDKPNNTNINKKEETDKKLKNIKNNENEDENINSNNNINVEFEPNPEILEQLNNNQFTETSTKEYDCPICFKTSSKYPELTYSMSKCHHVLCNICWSGWLAEKLECPLCKAKARPKTLKRLIFIK